jgi:hypothetical protein
VRVVQAVFFTIGLAAILVALLYLVMFLLISRALG